MTQRKRWRYLELAPSEITRTVRIRTTQEAMDWFAGLTAAQRGELVQRWHQEIDNQLEPPVESSSSSLLPSSGAG